MEEEYGSTEIVKQGTDVVRTAVTKAFDLLRGAYNGKVDKNFFSSVMHAYMHYPLKFVQVKFSCGTQEQRKKVFSFVLIWRDGLRAVTLASCLKLYLVMFMFWNCP